MACDNTEIQNGTEWKGNTMSAPGKPRTFLKPTVNTKFHIDYDWWERENSDLRSYILTQLPPEKRDYFEQHSGDEVVDYIDPETGEVRQLDELGLAIQQAAAEEDFINAQTSLVDSVFRAFLANGNVPLNPRELADITGRDAQTILKTVGGPTTYRGIRAYHPEAKKGSKTNAETADETAS